MIRMVFFVVLLSLAGCTEYCGQRLSSLVTLAQDSDAPKNAKYVSALKRTLIVCPIPNEGVEQPPGGPIHAAHVYFILGDIDAASDLLETGKYPMSNEQEFFLVSHAVVHENDQYFKALLDAGFNPNASLPGTGVTVFMDAAHAGPNATTRMQQLIDLGADPFSISDDGFSALDSAVLAESDEAVKFMLRLIEQSDPSRLALIGNAISIADQMDENRAATLREWRGNQSGAPLSQ